MTLESLPGFQSLKAHHCVTGSMRHVYVYNGHPISEEMLLGIGAGVSFSYWHFKGQTPFMGGRGNVRGEFEPLVGARTGVVIEAHTTSSARKAEQTLLAMLDAGQPVMIQCDMGFLPYFDFGGQEYHFGWHVVVVCGVDVQARQVLVADRDGLHPVSMEDLEEARGSRHKPWPPEHKWYTFDFTRERQPTADEVRQSIAEQAQMMLEPPISNIGVEGIRKAARSVPQWPRLLDEDALRETLFNAFIFIDETGGSGGGIFRYMFSRFLREAAELTADARLDESAAAFQQIGDRWQAVAEIFKQAWAADDLAALLTSVKEPLLELADLEEAAWMRLRKSAGNLSRLSGVRERQPTS